MNKTYCQHCGHRMFYEAAKPKHCSDCTKPLGGNVAVAKQRPTVQEDYQEEYEEEYVDDRGLPDISNIRLNVGLDAPTGVELGRIAGSTTGKNIFREGGKRRKVTASSLRKRVKSDAPIDL